jgi:hypothetical protein
LKTALLYAGVVTPTALLRRTRALVWGLPRSASCRTAAATSGLVRDISGHQLIAASSPRDHDARRRTYFVARSMWGRV